MDSFTILVNALPKLTPDQLKELKARATMLLGSPPSSAAPVSGPANMADHVLSLVVEYMQGKGIDGSGLAALRAANAYPHFKSSVDAAIKWFAPYFATRVELDAMLSLAIRLMHHDIKGRGWPVNSRTIMRSFHELPSIVEYHFPRYREMGILRLLISGIMSTKTGRELADVRKK